VLSAEGYPEQGDCVRAEANRSPVDESRAAREPNQSRFQGLLSLNWKHPAGSSEAENRDIVV
jgi:hypothetical protein